MAVFRTVLQERVSRYAQLDPQLANTITQIAV